LNEFYAAFGYTKEINKTGILPEEFIWEEYIKDGASHTECMQTHLIEYLNIHSGKFRSKYGDRCDEWITAHAKTRNEKSDLCFTCRMKPFCSTNMPQL
jgi:hypothetical protein